MFVFFAPTSWLFSGVARVKRSLHGFVAQKIKLGNSSSGADAAGTSVRSQAGVISTNSELL
jgi:hypothetical protein